MIRFSKKMPLSIDQKLAGLSKTSNNQFIFRVHERLRMQNEAAFEPEIMSIGPYHHGKESLKKMENYKLQYLQGILERRRESSAQRYVAALTDVEKEARDCYAEDFSLSTDDFVEMMLLDGCFVIEFLRRQNGIVEELEDDLIFSVEWYHLALCRDLLRFENQLPFFILELLFDMSKIENHPHDNLISLSISCLRDCFDPQGSYEINQPTTGKAFHILRLMHESWCSEFSEATDIQVVGECQSIRIELKKMLRCRKEQSQLEDGPTDMEAIKSVCELMEYGIKFEKAKESKPRLDIKFENGIIKIPTFVVKDGTECILRNLIAYEQYITVIAGSSRKVVTDYTTFMDSLINSSMDVQILSDKKIIRNWLGSDEELSNMINKIGINVSVTAEQFSYRKVFEDVNEHCSRWHTWIAELKRKYFHNPWAIISFIGAIFFLLLTTVNTVFDIYNGYVYYSDKDY